MTREYCEGFQRPVDPFTGQPYAGVPPGGSPSTNRPMGNGYIVLRDDQPDRQAGVAACPTQSMNGAY